MGSITMVKKSIKVNSKNMRQAVKKVKAILKRKPRLKPRPAQTKAIVLSNVSITDQQKQIIFSETPKEFIKERPGRGGNKVRYVEGGYVVSQLNSAFGPLNWEFEIMTEDVDDKEVTVRGKITVKDHIKGFSIGKTQYGGHKRETNVPLGDTKKAAATDALKKCASLFGIALDVYWKQLDEEPKKTDNKEVKPKDRGNMTPAEMFQESKRMIEECNSVDTLREWRGRIVASKNYTPGPKESLIKQIDEKLKKQN